MRRSKYKALVCLCFITSFCYGNDIEINIRAITETLKNPKDHPNDIIFIVTDKWPEYIGGQKEMYKFISENLNQSVAIKKGVVALRFVIEKDGSVGDVEVMRSFCKTCDEEAKRVIKLMPKWIPAQIKNRNARSYYNMAISFK
jgi:hypothetical protein